jgi:acetyl-CoA acyltransferase
MTLNELVRRAAVEPAAIDDVVWGCVSQVGEQTFDIARTAVLSAGWPDSVPGTTVDRQCGSSQQAIHFAAAGVMSGQYDLVVAGGVESMSRIPMGSAASVGGSPFGVSYRSRFGEKEPHQGGGSELIARRWAISRGEADELACASHARADAASRLGEFVDQMFDIEIDGERRTADEGIRPTTTTEVLAGLPAAFADDGVHHAGNSSQISDGSAALLITSSERARQLGLVPMARIHTAVVVGSDPTMMLTGPIAATERALKRSGLQLEDIGTFEVNEAFASVVLAWAKETGADLERVNPQGGAIALGHPLGASGARLATTLIFRMRQHNQRFGLQTMCEGGGQANATIFELLS